MPEPQNYSNHTRWFPLFHFVIIPLLLLNLIEHLVRIYMSSGAERWEQAFWALFSFVLILLALAARMMVVKVQDRVIRLEERLRYKEILSPDVATAASNLNINQIIALRFASDEELPELAAKVIDGTLKTQKEIKMAVKNWRADHLRA